LANIITLGVRDFAAEREFYRRLHRPLVLDSEEFVVFELREQNPRAPAMESVSASSSALRDRAMLIK